MGVVYLGRLVLRRMLGILWVVANCQCIASANRVAFYVSVAITSTSGNMFCVIVITTYVSSGRVMVVYGVGLVRDITLRAVVVMVVAFTLRVAGRYAVGNVILPGDDSIQFG